MASAPGMPADAMSPGRIVPGCWGDSSSSRTLHAPAVIKPTVSAAVVTHLVRSAMRIISLRPCGLVVEVETERVIPARSRRRECALDVTGAEVLLWIRTLVLGPDLQVARAKAQRRARRSDATEHAARDVPCRRQLTEAPELTVLEIAPCGRGIL